MPGAIPKFILRKIYAQAVHAYPEECCGWLGGPRQQLFVATYHPSANVHDSKENAFRFSDQALFSFAKSFDTASPAKIIYHSHCNAGIYFSDADQKQALGPGNTGPLYPVQHLVVGVSKAEVTGASLFEWSSQEAKFIETQVFSLLVG